jgi:hypothetical protein
MALNRSGKKKRRFKRRIQYPSAYAALSANSLPLKTKELKSYTKMEYALKKGAPLLLLKKQGTALTVAKIRNDCQVGVDKKDIFFCLPRT